MTDKNKEYKLPGPLAAALATNRPELVSVFISEVKTGHEVLTPEIQAEMLQLLVDLIQDREEGRARFAELSTSIKHLSNSARGLSAGLELLHTEMNK